MVDNELIRQARELLAAEWEKEGAPFVAGCIRRDADLTLNEQRAIRAIVAALRASSAGVAPIKEEGWLRVMDEALICAHITVADAEDTYADAKSKLGALLDWHIAVATDPAVNGGFALVPVEPTQGMADRAHAAYEAAFSKGEAFKDCARIAVAAALEQTP